MSQWEARAYLRDEHRLLLAQHQALLDAFRTLQSIDTRTRHIAHRAELREHHYAVANHQLAWRIVFKGLFTLSS